MVALGGEMVVQKRKSGVAAIAAVRARVKKKLAKALIPAALILALSHRLPLILSHQMIHQMEKICQ